MGLYPYYGLCGLGLKPPQKSPHTWAPLARSIPGRAVGWVGLFGLVLYFTENLFNFFSLIKILKIIF